MPARARWSLIAAVVLLATGFFLPLWRVDLVAPQYPEGLGMLIRVNGVDGLKPNDLQSINGLNHYIGMHTIEPDEIEELEYMPWILGGLIAAGLAVALLRRRVPLYLYAVALCGVMAAGLWDYWRWGYEYGHDLDDEHAIIKVPGMTYSPPVIGRKKLLNFTATSWPASGGIALGLATALVVYAAASTAAGSRRAIVMAAAVAACGGSGPRAVVAGEDACAYCRMEVSDLRFAAEVVTETGRVHVFDSVDCLTGFVRGVPRGSMGAVWVTDADHPGTFVAADSAGYLVESSLRGPMGMTVAFASPDAARAAQARYGGRVAAWDAVLAAGAAHGSP